MIKLLQVVFQNTRMTSTPWICIHTVFSIKWFCVRRCIHRFTEQPYRGRPASQRSTEVGKGLVSQQPTIPTALLFASLNYLSPSLPPNCSTPVGQLGIEAGGHCHGKIGSCCLSRSLWNCISAWRPCFQEKLLFFPIDPVHKSPSARIFFRICNNFVQQQLGGERKSINCALSPSRPSAQVPESQ